MCDLFSGNEELGYWWANFYNLSFSGVQIRIWTCINNILKYNLRKRYFGVKYVFLFSENHVKLEVQKNSVIGGRIFII